MGGLPRCTMAMMPPMPQMPNKLVTLAMHPQQSMNETVLPVSPPLHAMNANICPTPPGPFELNQLNESSSK